MTKNKSKNPDVRCSYAALRPPRSLSPNPRNPNKHGPSQLRVYAKILMHQGWRKPIIVSKQTGFIVAGHGAWLAALEQGWTSVPVDMQEFKSSADEMAHMIADNRLPQMAEMDQEELAAVLRDDIEGKLDGELAGLALDQAPAPIELKPVPIKAPPKMAWVLIGIPLVRFSEIAGDVQRISNLQETIVQSTVNDQVE